MNKVRYTDEVNKTMIEIIVYRKAFGIILGKYVEDDRGEKRYIDNNSKIYIKLSWQILSELNYENVYELDNGVSFKAKILDAIVKGLIVSKEFSNNYDIVKNGYTTNYDKFMRFELDKITFHEKITVYDRNGNVDPEKTYLKEFIFEPKNYDHRGYRSKTDEKDVDLSKHVYIHMSLLFDNALMLIQTHNEMNNKNNNGGNYNNGGYNNGGNYNNGGYNNGGNYNNGGYNNGGNYNNGGYNNNRKYNNGGYNNNYGNYNNSYNNNKPATVEHGDINDSWN